MALFENINSVLIHFTLFEFQCRRVPLTRCIGLIPLLHAHKHASCIARTGGGLQAHCTLKPQMQRLLRRLWVSLSDFSRETRRTCALCLLTPRRVAREWKTNQGLNLSPLFLSVCLLSTARKELAHAVGSGCGHSHTTQVTAWGPLNHQ